jgi:Lrp/AsnC family transcriptional regulator for asnA, asnC and gidA
VTFKETELGNGIRGREGYMRRDSRIIKITSNEGSTSINSIRIDSIDIKIIELLTFGHSNKEISDKLQVPLSTVQRRARKLGEKELIVTRTEPNYEKLGFKRGLIHVYLSKGEIDSVGQKISKMRGILSASVHVGNSDLVGFFIYRNTKQLLKMTTDVKQMQGVDKVMWSEEVYSIKVEKSRNGKDGDTRLFLE